MKTPRTLKSPQLQPAAATYNVRYLQLRWFYAHGYWLSKRQLRRQHGKLKSLGHYRRNKIFGVLSQHCAPVKSGG